VDFLFVATSAAVCPGIL